MLMIQNVNETDQEKSCHKTVPRTQIRNIEIHCFLLNENHSFFLQIINEYRQMRPE